MQIQRCGSQPSAPGPAAYFSGNVRIDAAFGGAHPGPAGGAIATFELVPEPPGTSTR